jgi:hypothetical protein
MRRHSPDLGAHLLLRVPKIVSGLRAQPQSRTVAAELAESQAISAPGQPGAALKSRRYLQRIPRLAAVSVRWSTPAALLYKDQPESM